MTGTSAFLCVNSTESSVLEFSGAQCIVQLPPLRSNETVELFPTARVVAAMGSGGNAEESLPADSFFIVKVQLL
jgi:hypothetical protein